VIARLLRISIFCMVIGPSLTAGHAQSPSALTADITIACPKDEDFTRYATLLSDDVSAAILFEHDHGCVTLQPGAFVRVDQGSLQRETNHVCIRPTGSYDCFWTFAAHVKAAN
jgi:hypothetical protein